VLLDALADYGGTLIFVSHDRYFVERLATRIVEVGDGKATLYPGTYAEYLWSKERGVAAGPERAVAPVASGPAPSPGATGSHPTSPRVEPAVARKQKTAVAAAVTSPKAADDYEARKRDGAERKKREKAFKALQDRITALEARIAEREQAVKDLEAAMSAAGFYEAHDTAKTVIDKHQHLMWEVGDLLNQWEMLQAEAAGFDDLKP